MDLLVSIIVPVYNVERYLPRCIESILTQTYTNFELILVDDGTPDRSGIICDRYAEKDARIRVIHKENGGVSTARNAGMDAARGEWITFIDSDDWVAEKYLELLKKPLQQDDYDLTVGCSETRSMVIDRTAFLERTITQAKINTTELLSMVDSIEFCGPCLKLYSKQIIDKYHLRFPEGVVLSEDTIFVNSYLQHCTKIYVISDTIYYYNRLNELSIVYRTPFFEERPSWDRMYIESYSSFLSAFSVDNKLFKAVISRKAISTCCINIRTIINRFPEFVAKDKIANILPQYSHWISEESEWMDHESNKAYSLLAQHIKNCDAEALYEKFKYVNQQTFLTKAKRIVKKILRPFIERYRDGLVKFKF